MKAPLPTWLTQTSNEPSRSERNATNFPSEEIVACSSEPSKSVSLLKPASAKGFCRKTSARVRSQAATAAKAAKENAIVISTRGPQNPGRRGSHEGSFRGSSSLRPLEVYRQLAHRLVAIGRILFQRFFDDRPQRRRQVRPEIIQRWRILVKDGQEQLMVGFPTEWPMSRQGFIEHCAK
jgi:hypothetical protein